MKKTYYFVAILLIIFNPSFSQHNRKPAVRDLPQDVISDFARAVNFSWYYANNRDAFKGALIPGLRAKGLISPFDIERTIQDVGKSKGCRDLVLGALADYAGFGRLNEILLKMDIPVNSARVLTSYAYAQAKKQTANNRVAERQQEQEQLADDKREYNDANLQYQSAIKTYISNGAVLYGDSLSSLLSKLPNFYLLTKSLNASDLSKISKSSIKIEYKKDSLIQFLNQHFRNEVIYFTITNDGKLVSIKNKSNAVLQSKDYPLLNQFIKITGNFSLIINNVEHPVNYCFPALSIQTSNCPQLTKYYFSLGSKEIEYVNDSTAVVKQITTNRFNRGRVADVSTPSECTPISLFRFDKFQIQKAVFDYANIDNIKELKKASRPSLLLLLSTDERDNLYRFTDIVNKEDIIVDDLLDSNIQFVKTSIISNVYQLDVFNPNKEDFDPIKIKGGIKAK